MKPVADDVKLVMAGVTVSVIFILAYSNAIRSTIDVYIYFGTFGGLLLGPIFYSYYINKKG